VAKSFVYGNGSIVVGLDQYGQVYDFYFPYVGLENHTGGRYTHKIGVWAQGLFHWLDDGSWTFEHKYVTEDNRIVAKLSATNTNLGVSLEWNDEVYNELNIFLRTIKVKNLYAEPREIRLFLNQQFELYESYRGDTAYYDPENNVIIHYKGRRIFLINACDRNGQCGFTDYSVGLFGIEGKQGTFKDAEDGVLHKNPIEHGLTDSVIGLNLNIEGHGESPVDYWICVAKTMDEVYQLNSYVKEKTTSYLINTTQDYWQAWLTQKQYDFKDLTQEEQNLFFQSLKVMRVHTDKNGAIIASCDSDLLKYGRDAYSYVWPRDAAFISMAYARTGYDDVNKTVMTFFNDTITRQGYFMHKYRSDKSLGSSWHPWIYQGQFELPIQLDETALVVIALWEDFQQARDIEFIESIYNALLVKAVNFIISRIDTDTGIVKPSYDLWEEHYGSSTFTSATVYGALMAASDLAKTFGKADKSEEYALMAKLVRNAILEFHYNNDTGLFYKRIIRREHSIDGEEMKDTTFDMSALFGLFKFNVLDVNDDKINAMKEYALNHMDCGGEVGGFPRYEGDVYFKTVDTVKGNPWLITTMWFAQICIAQAQSIEELQKCHQYISWVNMHASDSGMLSEQLNPTTGTQISATPLVWSHAEYVKTVLDYVEKFRSLEHHVSEDQNISTKMNQNAI
jgi:GH15 family glucan-1,4-alpha-glucosidase